ncbi:unnamed protein product [Closterium sp. NIES-54]
MVLNGTEILIREVSSHYSLELSIRTTRHVDRVDQFDREMRAAWEHLCGLMADWIRTGGGTSGHGGWAVEAAILRFAYFWHQALPLSRGTAMLGYATLQGLFLAAGKEITASIPPRMQVDWEAMLTPSVDDFISRMSDWIYPSIVDARSFHTLPGMHQAFPTVDSVLKMMADV